MQQDPNQTPAGFQQPQQQYQPYQQQNVPPQQPSQQYPEIGATPDYPEYEAQNFEQQQQQNPEVEPQQNNNKKGQGAKKLKKRKDQSLLHQINQFSQQTSSKCFNLMENQNTVKFFAKAEGLEINPQKFQKSQEKILKIANTGNYTNIKHIIFALIKAKGNEEKAAQILKQKYQKHEEQQQNLIRKLVENNLKFYDNILQQINTQNIVDFEESPSVDNPYYSLQQQQQQQQQTDTDQQKVLQFLGKKDDREQDMKQQKKMIQQQQKEEKEREKQIKKEEKQKQKEEKQKEKEDKKANKKQKAELVQQQSPVDFSQLRVLYVSGATILNTQKEAKEVLNEKGRPQAQLFVQNVVQNAIQKLNLSQVHVFFGKAQHPVNTQILTQYGQSCFFSATTIDKNSDVGAQIEGSLRQGFSPEQISSIVSFIGQDKQTMEKMTQIGVKLYSVQDFWKLIIETVGEEQLAYLSNEAKK